MKVILATDNKIHSLAIRIFTWSDYHHGGVVVGDEVIEARADKGVIKTPLESFKRRYKGNYIIFDIPHRGDYQRRLHSQLGKPYDWGAIFKFVLRGDWSKEDKWFCFELIAYASGVLSKDFLDRVTANHLLMIREEDT